MTFGLIGTRINKTRVAAHRATTRIPNTKRGLCWVLILHISAGRVIQRPPMVTDPLNDEMLTSGPPDPVENSSSEPGVCSEVRID